MGTSILTREHSFCVDDGDAAHRQLVAAAEAVVASFQTSLNLLPAEQRAPIRLLADALDADLA